MPTVERICLEHRGSLLRPTQHQAPGKASPVHFLQPLHWLGWAAPRQITTHTPAVSLCSLILRPYQNTAQMPSPSQPHLLELLPSSLGQTTSPRLQCVGPSRVQLISANNPTAACKAGATACTPCFSQSSVLHITRTNDG